MKLPWSTVAIVGVGLIGGSLGRALLTRRLCHRVIGIGRNQASLAEALRRELVTDVSCDVAAVKEADFVVVGMNEARRDAAMPFFSSVGLANCGGGDPGAIEAGRAKAEEVASAEL